MLAINAQRWINHGEVQNADVAQHFTLKPGSYHAKLKDPIFIEPGLAKMKDWNTRTAVYGRYTLGQSQEAQP